MNSLLYIVAVILLIGWALGVFMYSATGIIPYTVGNSHYSVNTWYNQEANGCINQDIIPLK